MKLHLLTQAWRRMHLPSRSSFRLNLCPRFLGNAISAWKDIPAPRTGGFHRWSECLDHFLHVSEKVRRVWFVFKWRSSIGVDQWSQVQELCWGPSQVPERLGVETDEVPVTADSIQIMPVPWWTVQADRSAHSRLRTHCFTQRGSV